MTINLGGDGEFNAMQMLLATLAASHHHRRLT